MASKNEERLAKEIMKAVKRLNLPLKLDRLTEAKGDCFPLAIISQCKRPEIFHTLNSSIQEVIEQNDPSLLRMTVINFMMDTLHPKVKEYEANYKKVLAFEENGSWTNYWKSIVQKYEWVDQTFVQATAWLLNHDIMVILTSGSEDNPYLTVSGNLMNENIRCPGAPLIVGCKSNVHYQSLLPTSYM